MTIQDVICARRDGRAHTREELVFLARGAAEGTIPDYQLSAWLMAAFLNPLGEEETAWLTSALADSGERIDLTGLPKPWVDKHSTGGVGDKTTLVLLPLLAACGLTVVKMSGRGLGITGGTIDKLESIPGFRVDLSPAELKAQASKIGLAITGQTPDLAPADKVLYALRDATGTVASIPLIVSSILSKKLAGGAEVVVLDVKAGSGAFMKSLEEARVLAGALTRTAELVGLKVKVALTDMDEPLGTMVGNALEVREALSVLSAGRDTRFRRLCVEFAALALEASGVVPDRGAGRAMAGEALASGRALAKAREWFAAQGATLGEDGTVPGLPVAPVVLEAVYHGHKAWVTRIDAQAVGEAVVALGGGRVKKTDVVDPAVGIELCVQVGDAINEGLPLFRVHAATPEAGEIARERVRDAIDTVPHLVPARSLFL